MSNQADVLLQLQTIRARARTIDLPAIDAAVEEIRHLRGQRDQYLRRLAISDGGIDEIDRLQYAHEYESGERLKADIEIALLTVERDQLRTRIAAMEDDGK